MDKKNEVEKGARAVIPIVLGYLPVGIAFGVLARSTGISFSQTSLFSIMVYAGASQFMALDLIQAGIGGASIILATFLLNLRHMVMSASLSTRLGDIKRVHFPLVAFAITDETFSVLSFTEGKLNLLFVLLVNFVSYFAWVMATILGFFLGEILPPSLQGSLGIGLYGMFAALLFPQFKGNRTNLYIGLLAAGFYILCDYFKLFPMGWDIIIAILVSSALGVLLFDNGERKDIIK